MTNRNKLEIVEKKRIVINANRHDELEILGGRVFDEEMISIKDVKKMLNEANRIVKILFNEFNRFEDGSTNVSVRLPTAEEKKIMGKYGEELFLVLEMSGLVHSFNNLNKIKKVTERFLVSKNIVVLINNKIRDSINNPYVIADLLSELESYLRALTINQDK